MTNLLLIVSLSGICLIITRHELRLSKKLLNISLIIIILPWALPKSWLDIKPSPYKPLAQIQNIMGTQIVEKKSSALAELSVVENLQVPFRHAPGLALNSPSPLPKQLAIFSDGDGMSTINYYDGQRKSLSYLAHIPSALSYQLLNTPDVLVLGAGGGTEALQALYFNANKIDAVELNPQIVELLKNDFPEYSKHWINKESVNLHIAENRAFLEASNNQYDLIHLSHVDSFATAASGLHALNETYLYTVEAFTLYLNHLKNDGILSFSRWLKLPPRDALKLLNTAKIALLQLGVHAPQQHLALIRSWNTTTLIVKKSPLSLLDIQKIKTFCQNNSFDLSYYPGILESEANQYNLLSQAYFYQGAQALLANNSANFIDNYKYNLQAADDNSPYFFHFLKWQSLLEILQLPAGQGIALIEWGVIILFTTLVQAIVASIVLILLPLWLYNKRNYRPDNLKSFTFFYFSLLGIGFMFLEIAFIQRFILFLHNPSYAIAVVLAGFFIICRVRQLLFSTLAIG